MKIWHFFTLLLSCLSFILKIIRINFSTFFFLLSKILREKERKFFSRKKKAFFQCYYCCWHCYQNVYQNRRKKKWIKNWKLKAESLNVNLLFSWFMICSLRISFNEYNWWLLLIGDWVRKMMSFTVSWKEKEEKKNFLFSFSSSLFFWYR